MKALRSGSAWLVLLALSLGHGLNDFIASWLLSSLPPAQPALVLAGFLGYNAVAFAGQVPMALGLERWGGYRPAALLCLGVLPLAVLLAAGGALPAALAVAGLASALYHVAGSSLAMQLPLRPALAIGFFAAPGVVGLALGRLAAGAPLAGWWLLPLVGLLLLGVSQARASESHPRPAAASDVLGLPLGQGMLLLVLALAATRAALWHFTEGQLTWTTGGLSLAVAAGAGKLAGGWWLRRRWVAMQVAAVLGAAVLLLRLPGSPVAALLLGVGLLQSTVPVFIVLLTGLLRGRAGLANALAMGLTIVAGAFPLWWQPRGLGEGLGAGLLLLAGALLWLRYRRAARTGVPAAPEA